MTILKKDIDNIDRCVLEVGNENSLASRKGIIILLVHCNMKIRPEEVLFLYNNEEFTDRRVEKTHCPKCDKLIIRVTERRILDDVVIDIQYQKGKAEKKLIEISNEINYTSNDFKPLKQAPSGWKYGLNKEITNKKTGETTISQYTSDFYGNKEITKKFTQKS